MAAAGLVLPLLWPTAGVASAYAEGRGWIADCSPIAQSFGAVARRVGNPFYRDYYIAIRRSFELGRKHTAPN